MFRVFIKKYLSTTAYYYHHSCLFNTALSTFGYLMRFMQQLMYSPTHPTAWQPVCYLGFAVRLSSSGVEVCSSFVTRLGLSILEIIPTTKNLNLTKH